MLSPTCSFRVLEFSSSDKLCTVFINRIRKLSRFEKDSDELVTSPSSGLRRRSLSSSINDLLPAELIEVMLSKCPVKSVVRFKSVCKLWHAIISVPRFLRVHRIERSKVWENEKMYLEWVYCVDYKPSNIYLMRLGEDGMNLGVESVFEYRPLYKARSFFSPMGAPCDGIFLLDTYWNKNCTLWNPSIQKGITIRPPDDMNRRGAGVLSQLYHDPTSDDYKIALVDYKYYNVYSCKSGRWGERKDLPCRLRISYRPASPVDGCFYQLGDDGKILCFDARDGKVDKFGQPPQLEGDIVEIAQVSGRLCLYSLTEDRSRIQLWVMEKEKKNWRKMMSMQEINLRFSRPVCLIEQDKVVLLLQERGPEFRLMEIIYNTSQKTFQKFHLNGVCATQLYPCKENLYLPSSNILLG